MSPLHSNEETHLLPNSRRTPLPWFQFSIILFLHLAEPLSAVLINPFAPQLIRDIGVTNGEEARVGYYVGLLQSLFYLAQATTILFWSRLSDRIGRKPVILMGLAGMSISTLCFGLSKTITGLMISRCLSGALDGNIGVIKGMLADITDATNISQAYSYLPITWAAGAALAPVIGGFFSKPAERFPDLFGDSNFMKTFPYFLPCFIAATFAVVAWIVTFSSLEETVSSPSSLFHVFFARHKTSPQNRIDVRSEESCSFVDAPRPVPLRALLVRRVILATMNYVALSFIDIAYRTINPLFLSTPIELGGLGLPPSQIGVILSVHAVLNCVFVACFLTRAIDCWSPKTVFTAGIASSMPVFACFPILSYIVRYQGVGVNVWLVIAFQLCISLGLGLAFGSIFIYIAASSPNRSSFGATNGLAQTSVSVMRSIGPAAVASLFSISLENHYLSGMLVHWVLVAIVAASIMVAYMLP